jgi:hypothetical protein
MAPLRGWALRGRRIEAKVPHGRHGRFAPLHHRSVVHRGAINGESFLLYIEKLLVPTLQRGDIVVIDNLARTKLTPCVSSSVLLPAEILTRSEPDRAVLRQVQTLAVQGAHRTTEAVYDAIAQSLTVSPAECANYFANAGYDQI